MKKLISITLTVVMLLSLASVMMIHGSAIVEGDWTVSRAADDYQDPDSYRPYC